MDGVFDIYKYLSFAVFCDHNIDQGHLRSPGKKGQTKNFGI